MYILTRNPKRKNEILWDAKTLGEWKNVLENSDVLINCKKNNVPVWIINPITNSNLPGIKINAIRNEVNETESLVEKNFNLFSF